LPNQQQDVRFGPSPAETERMSDATTFWNDHYAGRPAPSDPRPNVRLTEFVEELPMGDALDLGCGGGGDALWLARQGWHVTATDISTVAVSRLNDLARSLDLGDRVRAVRHDLCETFPEGKFDLVSAHYLQTQYEFDRPAALRRAAHALKPGGLLLVVDHGSFAPWSWSQDPSFHFPTPKEVAAGIALNPAGWSIERAEAMTRVATGPDGKQQAEVVDHVLMIRRAD
jgi:SAM-dependent methyltransferase